MNKPTNAAEQNPTGRKPARTAISEAVSANPKNRECAPCKIDPAILSRIERYFDDSEITAIEVKEFTETQPYKDLKVFIHELNNQLFSSYLFQVTIEKLTPPQIQAILDEIAERN